MTEYITTEQAAKMLHITRQAVLYRCHKGRIPGAYQIEDGRGHWRIPIEWVNGILESIRPIRRRRPQ